MTCPPPHKHNNEKTRAFMMLRRMATALDTDAYFDEKDARQGLEAKDASQDLEGDCYGAFVVLPMPFSFSSKSFPLFNQTSTPDWFTCPCDYNSLIFRIF
ncbi:hypothetical protein E2542_SST24979 [Spatholobus suberectus]|nr:hypothetical protein E2542_SST24979 [Spatholobus suberectus]